MKTRFFWPRSIANDFTLCETDDYVGVSEEEDSGYKMSEMFAAMGHVPPNDVDEFPVVEAERCDHRRSVLDLLILHNRLGLVNKSVVKHTLTIYWNKYGFRAWIESLLLYLLFLFLWTMVIMLAQEHERRNYTPLRVAVECGASVLVLWYGGQEYGEWRQSLRLRQRYVQWCIYQVTG